MNWLDEKRTWTCGDCMATFDNYEARISHVDVCDAPEPKRRRHLWELTQRVTYPGFHWNIDKMGSAHYVQILYWEDDVEVGHFALQKGRKWYVSAYATDSEVIQTMLKAAITSAEHRVREHFLVDGVRAFGPHMDVDALVAHARATEEARRK